MQNGRSCVKSNLYCVSNFSPSKSICKESLRDIQLKDFNFLNEFKFFQIFRKQFENALDILAYPKKYFIDLPIRSEMNRSAIKKFIPAATFV